MTIKLLRRQTYLRERDYNRKFRPAAKSCGYQRIEWHPLTYNEISKNVLMLVLKGDTKYPDQEISYKCIENFSFGNPIQEGKLSWKYIEFLHRTNRLYGPDWDWWYWRYHEGYVQLRYRSGHNWETLGVGTVEREYDTIAHSIKIISQDEVSN